MSRAADRYFNKWFDNQEGEEEVMATVLMSGTAQREAAEEAGRQLARETLEDEQPTMLGQPLDEDATAHIEPHNRRANLGTIPPRFQSSHGFDYEPFLLDPEEDETVIRLTRSELPSHDLFADPPRTSRAALAAIPIGVALGAISGVLLGSFLLCIAIVAAL